MENYKKANVVDLDNPIHTYALEENCIHMHVKAGSKVANLMNYAYNHFQKDDINQITWNGNGDALQKTVACAEIMKKRFPRLYQINKVGFKKQEDNWEPTVEGLRNIKVVKEIPSICIILSKKQLDANEPGYQDENSIKNLFDSNKSQSKAAKKSTNDKLEDDDAVYIRKRSNKDSYNTNNYSAKKFSSVNTDKNLNK